MSILDYILGDRAGNYLLLSCLLVAALSIISAIIDIPLAGLYEAGLSRDRRQEFSPIVWLIRFLGFAALLVAVFGTAIQAYVASTPHTSETNATGLAIATDLAVAGAIVVWGLTPPLSRHWGLCLGAFGLGLAVLFLSLATVLRLDFELTGTLATAQARTAFAAATGTVLLAVAVCMAAILGLVAHLTAATLLLIREHRRHRGTGVYNVRRPPQRREPAVSSPSPALSTSPGDRESDE